MFQPQITASNKLIKFISMSFKLTKIKSILLYNSQFPNQLSRQNQTMPSFHSSQKSRIAKIQQNRSIDIDAAKIVQINDRFPVEEIILEEEAENFQNADRKLNQPQRTKRALCSSVKFSWNWRVMRDERICEEDHGQRGKGRVMEEFREKLLRTVSHFVSIESVSVRNKVSSENMYNMFQERRWIQEKLGQGVLGAKYWFQIEYTNKLSLLAHAIVEKQNRYDVYREHEQLQKVLSLIQTQIQDVTQLYIAHEEDKVHLIYSEDLNQAISYMRRQRLEPKEIEIIWSEQKQVNQMQEFRVEMQEIRQEIVIEKGECNQSIAEGNKTESQNSNQKPVLAQKQTDEKLSFSSPKRNADLEVNDISEKILQKREHHNEDINKIETENQDQAIQLIELMVQKESFQPELQPEALKSQRIGSQDIQEDIKY